MKICFIAPANNYHTQKWCTWFKNNGHEIHVISFTDAEIQNVYVYWINSGVGVEDSDRKKIKYLLQAPRIKNIVKEINPDIINVHYATSYGITVALSGIKKYVLSVWGSDIYEFPRKSIMHRLILKYSLYKASYLFSTSNAMAKEANKYTSKTFAITPFGVDMDLFSSDKRDRKEDGYFIVGTIKTLSPKYGIDCFLKAVAIVRNKHPEIPIQLRIAGTGPCEEEYKQLSKSLAIDDITTWLGFVSQNQAAKEWANMDLAVIFSVSESESFGVSAVEAQACEVAVIVSDVPGLLESTSPGNTSVVVPRRNISALANAIVDMYNHKEKRSQLGKRGREYVKKRYELECCYKKIENHFYNFINDN